ncbi:ROK family transcriptional regulator [Actinokineospora sp. 24-640]
MAGSARLLRSINDAAVLRLLLERGALTRAQLRGLTGLAKPTTSEVLRRLDADGLVRVSGRTSGRPGPNAEIYSVEPDAGFAAAVSVRAGDSSIAAVVCDVTGVVRGAAEGRASGDPVRDVAEVVKAAARRGHVAVSRVGVVQVAVPGAYDPAGDVVRLVDVAGWDRPGVGQALGKRLRAAVEVDNDVNLAAVAERAARGVGSFALLWLGEEGLGLAVVLDGRLVRGARGGAGEIGYLPVGPSGDFHASVGGAAVRELAARHGVDAETGSAAVARVCAYQPVSPLPADMPVHLADRGAGADSRDPGWRFLTHLGQRVARGVAAVVAVVEPPVVVVSGEVGRAGGLLLCRAVRSALRDLSVLRTDVVPSGVEGDAVLLGATEAARDRLWATLLDGR